MTRVNASRSTSLDPSAPTRAEASVRAEVVNPTIDWDTDHARAVRYLRSCPHTAGMSEMEVSRAAAQAVRRRQQRHEIKDD
jgi:hypothetical protein